MKFGILLSLCFVFSSFSMAAPSENDKASDATTVATDAGAETKTETTKLADDSLPVAAQPVEKAKSEDEIPVNLAKHKKSDATDASSGRLFLTFGLMAVVLGVGY